MNSLVTFIFVLSCLALLHTYALYPFALWLLTRWRGRPSPSSLAPELPHVSVIIPMHNEERWVTRKIDNTLSWEYPPDRLEIIVVSDGSTDRTDDLLSQYKARTDVISYQPRRGKPAALNAGRLKARGEVLVFTDANVWVEPKAIQTMMAWYRDSTVGGVSGNIALQAENSAEPLGEGLYMRYERWLYALESRLGTMIGVDGAFFSVRRRSFSQLPTDTITDDFAIALKVVAEGKRVVYEPDARGVELVVPDVRAEFRRKVRMIAGGYQALSRFRPLVNPFRSPMMAFQLLSHKLMRWLVPYFLGLAFLAALANASDYPIIAAAAITQSLFYALAVLGWISGMLRRWLPVYVPYYFCAVNLAAVAGLWRYLLGTQAITWRKVSR